jgi:hypothetical protein
LISSRHGGRRANAAGVAAIGTVFFGIDSTQSTGCAAHRVRAVCTIDYRLRRISDMDASRHRMTN